MGLPPGGAGIGSKFVTDVQAGSLDREHAREPVREGGMCGDIRWLGCW